MIGSRYRQRLDGGDDVSRVRCGSGARCCRSPTRRASSTSRAGSPSSASSCVSTGGTARALREGGLEVRSIEDFTGFPEIMDGRVKTLHPKLYAGLLALRDDDEHMAAAAEHEIEFVDLVCVNLYPFEATAARRGVDRARGDREHRHRRPDDDPRGGEELRLRARSWSTRPATTRSCRSSGRRRQALARHARVASPPRRSPTPPATTPRSRAGSSRSRTTSRRCS